MKRSVSLAAIGIAGVAGAIVRWSVGDLIGPTSFPWATLLVNVVGCGLLARVTWSSVRADVRTAIGAGFCGGLTTFSTFAVEVVTLADDHSVLRAAIYVAVSVGTGLAAFVLARPSRLTVETVP